MTEARTGSMYEDRGGTKSLDDHHRVMTAWRAWGPSREMLNLSGTRRRRCLGCLYTPGAPPAASQPLVARQQVPRAPRPAPPTTPDQLVAVFVNAFLSSPPLCQVSLPCFSSPVASLAVAMFLYCLALATKCIEIQLKIYLLASA